MDILEACIASAMPSKPSKGITSAQTADQQAAKFQQQRLSLGELKQSVFWVFFYLFMPLLARLN
jgi:SAMP Motif